MLKEFIMFLKGDYKNLMLNEVSFLDFCEMLNDNFIWQVEIPLENKDAMISLKHEKVTYYLYMEVEDDYIVFKKRRI